jgi:small subunit ribosomal protein S1
VTSKISGYSFRSKGGVDALIRNEDLHPLTPEELEIGQTIEAAILVIDAKRDRIRLSVKKLERLERSKNVGRNQ